MDKHQGRTCVRFKPADDIADSKLLPLFLGAVMLMIALTSIEGALFRGYRGDPIHWPELIRGRVAAWGTCAVFIPPLYLLTTRLPIGKRNWHVAAPTHVAASLLATVGKYSLYAPLVGFLEGAASVRWLEQLRAGLLGEMMFYWAMIGFAHAVFYYSRPIQAREDTAPPATADESLAPLSFSVGTAKEFLHPDDIYWVAAEGNYLLLHLKNRQLLVRHTLRAMEPRLPSNFVRIHRSVLINSRLIRRIEGVGRGKYRLELVNGASVASGFAYKEGVRRLAGKSVPA